ncbi:hypothetical protein NC651_009800 [Populus alba x Populus x berolinensis]|nr:hypothetical protein NC651_009800 [Populus alba x Populus x berolinensis]
MCSFEKLRNLDVNKNGGRRKDTIGYSSLETPATCCRFGRESWNISTRMSCGRIVNWSNGNQVLYVFFDTSL